MTLAGFCKQSYRPIRYAARYVAVSAAASLSALVAGSLRASVQFVVLHGARPREEARLADTVKRLASEFKIIHYSEAVERIITRRIDQPYLALSVDDGLQTARSIARILTERGLSACFFVCPAALDLNGKAGATFCRRRLQVKQEPLLGWRDVEVLAGQGHEIGGHTMSHAILSELTSDQLIWETGECYRRLKHQLGTARHFALPFGRTVHFNQSCINVVFQSGFKSCATAIRGYHTDTDANSDGYIVLKRHPIGASWPYSHVRYFLNL